MRVNNLEAAPPRAPRAPGEARAAGGEVFLQEVQRVQREKLNQDLEVLMRNIEETGERLASTMSLDDLVAYKQLIGDFIRTINQSSTQVSTSLSWGYLGQQQRFTIVREIDKGLAELRDLLLAEEKDHLAIVSMVDNIRGLVLDLRV